MGVFDDFGAILPNGKMAKVAKSPTDFLCLDFRMREAIYRMSAWPRLQIRVSANSAKPPHGGNNENDEKRGILGDFTTSANVAVWRNWRNWRKRKHRTLCSIG